MVLAVTDGDHATVLTLPADCMFIAAVGGRALLATVNLQVKASKNSQVSSVERGRCYLWRNTTEPYLEDFTFCGELKDFFFGGGGVLA